MCTIAKGLSQLLYGWNKPVTYSYVFSVVVDATKTEIATEWPGLNSYITIIYDIENRLLATISANIV